MPVMQPPTGPIEVSDPNNVPETFVNGPFNIAKGGGLVHLTFTAARPNPSDLFKGSNTPGFQATVTCRLLMPMETAEHCLALSPKPLARPPSQPTRGRRSSN